MASTYTLISSNTLSSSAASVTFSSIPATYTDLVLKVSARTDVASTQSNLAIEINGNTSAIYSSTFLFASGSTAYSQQWTGDTYGRTYGNAVGSTATSNTFSNAEIYIPSYLASQNKPFSVTGATENNSATSNSLGAFAELFRSTTAISSLRLFANDSSNFVSGSSFYLYGIKNS